MPCGASTGTVGAVGTLDRPGHDRPWRVLFLDAEPMWRDTLPAGLEDLGHEVEIVTRIREDALAQTIAAHRPDFALTVGWGTLHVPDNLTVIRRTLAQAGVPHVYWDVESVNNLERWVLPYIHRTRPDLVCTISAESIPAIERLGVPARFLTFGCNPRVHRPTPPSPEFQCDFALVATAWNCWRDDRGTCLRQLLVPLLPGPARVGVWGRLWDQLPPEAGFQVPAALRHGPVPYNRAADVYASAAAVLGPQNELHTGTQLTMRTFEILGCGAPLLTYRTPAVTRLFVPGRHLLATHSSAETQALARWLLEHPDRRRELADAGRREVMARHTYRHRAQELLEHVAATLPAFGGTAWPSPRRSAWYGEVRIGGPPGREWLPVPLTVTVPVAGLPPTLQVDRAYLCLFGVRSQQPVVLHCLHGEVPLDSLQLPDGAQGRWCEWNVTDAVARAQRAGLAEIPLRIVPAFTGTGSAAFRWHSWTAPSIARPHAWITGTVEG